MVLSPVLLPSHTLITSYQDYSMENWPISPSCNDALESIKHAHHVNPIATYDIQGKLVCPTACCHHQSVLPHHTLPAQKVK